MKDLYHFNVLRKMEGQSQTLFRPLKQSKIGPENREIGSKPEILGGQVGTGCPGCECWVWNNSSPGGRSTAGKGDMLFSYRLAPPLILRRSPQTYASRSHLTTDLVLKACFLSWLHSSQFIQGIDSPQIHRTSNRLLHFPNQNIGYFTLPHSVTPHQSAGSQFCGQSNSASLSGQGKSTNSGTSISLSIAMRSSLMSQQHHHEVINSSF